MFGAIKREATLKLPARLEMLQNMIAYPYEHIWDCCCDHGYLGYSILNKSSTEGVVHFLDVVESIVIKVKKDLDNSDFDRTGWKTHCLDLKSLVLPLSEKKQLLIIAGVGGDLTVDFVEAVLRNNPNTEVDFLLCPIRQLYKVRVELDKLGLSLIEERIVKDSGRCYELIYLSTGDKKKLHPVGDLMWDLAQADHREYLNQNIQHYQRVMKQLNSSASAALDAYIDVRNKGLQASP